MTSANYPVIKGFAKNNQPYIQNIPDAWGGNTSWNQQEIDQKIKKENLENEILFTAGFEELKHILEYA